MKTVERSNCQTVAMADEDAKRPFRLWCGLVRDRGSGRETRPVGEFGAGCIEPGTPPLLSDR